MKFGFKLVLGVLIGFVGILSLTQSGRSEEVYQIIIKKQEEKAKNRWSLSQWFEAKEKMRLMDMWLALHTPSPYEFYLEGHYTSLTRSPGGSFNGYGLKAGGYATVAGLEATYENMEDLTRASAAFKLRVFGYHIQATHIVLGIGYRTQTGTAASNHLLASVEAALYFSRFFGFDGGYYKYFDPGTRYEVGAFIDFKFLRIFGKYLSERDQGIGRDGPYFGARLFF